MNYKELIEKTLNEFKNKDYSLKLMFDELNLYNSIIIGGFIRDAINGEDVRDIDIILNEKKIGIIETIIDKYNLRYKKNRFNGYKLFFNDLTLDIWYIEDHNLFKQGIYQPIFNNLKETTFTNYDSLVYDLKTKTLDIEYYLECINSNTIDFVGSKEAIMANPSPFLSIVKILDIIYQKKIDISKEVYDYIFKYYQEGFIDLLKEEYLRHYNYNMPLKLERYIENFMDSQKVKKITLS